MKSLAAMHTHAINFYGRVTQDALQVSPQPIMPLPFRSGSFSEVGASLRDIFLPFPGAP
jgi:hypothetical protein